MKTILQDHKDKTKEKEPVSMLFHFTRSYQLLLPDNKFLPIVITMENEFTAFNQTAITYSIMQPAL